MNQKMRSEVTYLNIPKFRMAQIVKKYGICPELGARETSFEAFQEWYQYLSEEDKKLDVLSLVDGFEFDLERYSSIEKREGREEDENPASAKTT